MHISTGYLGPSLPFPHFLAQKIKIFEKKKKAPGYIIILHLHPKNHNHLMYSSLKMVPTALQVILGQFLPFYSISGPILKNFWEWKNAWNVLKILKIKNILKITIISHVVPQIECGQDFCQFGVIFLPLPHFWPKKSKFPKMRKKHLEILPFCILLGV